MASSQPAAISIQHDDFDAGYEIAQLGADPAIGAVASFVGLVRGDKVTGADKVIALELEHYAGMTERSIAEIIAAANERWSLRGVRVIHRIGRLAVGDRIVFVGVASTHRGNAFAACEFIMDYLKTQAPFWKKTWSDGGYGQWVDARESDYDAASRWQR